MSTLMHHLLLLKYSLLVRTPEKLLQNQTRLRSVCGLLCLLDTGGCNMFKMNLDSKELGCCSVHSQMEVLDGIFTQPSREKVGEW